MSTITTSSLSNTLPSSVPKLDADGKNWAIFLVHFMDTVEAKGFWGHFDGSSPAPVISASSLEAEKAEKLQWEKEERSAKTLLTQKLPNLMVMEIHSKKSVKERWEAVVKEYTKKGAFAQMEMRVKFLTSRCPERGSAKEFLRGLQLKKEELAQGVRISDNDYLSTIISSLPDNLSNFASLQMLWTMQQTQSQIDTSTLMAMLLQEAEHQDLRSQKRKQAGGKSKEDEKNEALAVSTEKPSGKRDMSEINCWNCGKPDHFSLKCKQPKKSKDSKSSGTTNSKEGTSAAVNAVDTSSDDEGAWAAEEISSDSEASDWLEDVTCDKDECSGAVDWFEEEVAAGEGFEERLNREVGSLDVEEFRDASGEVFVVAESVQTVGMAELYDSGCTNHISLYKNQFENFQSITLHHFCAANKQTFSTIGKGELIIDIPNSDGMTQLCLFDVLYSAEVGYMLVSIGRLDEASFMAVFGGGKCTLLGEDEVVIGVVPRTPTRVYKVEHEDGTANAAEERLTMDKFHRRMGHILPVYTLKLIRDKMVMGVHLEYSPTKDFFCPSCIFAKATRKAAPKLRESERAGVFGGEVHSDLWGKAPVESRGEEIFCHLY